MSISYARTSAFELNIELGQPFEPLFRQATAEFADSIELHRGDLLKETWPADRPIELLFVDIAKTFALSGKVVTEFFPHLIAGRSVVVHQDFYHPSTFYLPIVMDYLSDYFTIVEPSCDWSVAFRLEAPIPRNVSPPQARTVSLLCGRRRRYAA
jgi:hypothetical protein